MFFQNVSKPRVQISAPRFLVDMMTLPGGGGQENEIIFLSSQVQKKIFFGLGTIFFKKHEGFPIGIWQKRVFWRKSRFSFRKFFISGGQSGRIFDRFWHFPIAQTFGFIIAWTCTILSNLPPFESGRRGRRRPKAARGRRPILYIYIRI